jgi:hypothetical protein
LFQFFLANRRFRRKSTLLSFLVTNRLQAILLPPRGSIDLLIQINVRKKLGPLPPLRTRSARLAQEAEGASGRLIKQCTKGNERPPREAAFLFVNYPTERNVCVASIARKSPLS